MCRLAILSFHGCPVARLGEKDTGGMNVYVLQLTREFARKGIEVERRKRFIHLYNFQITEYEPPFAWFKVACTKGTYVRTLAHDLGQALGCGAHLAGLRRTVSGKFKVSAATPLEELTTLSPDDLARRVVPMLQLSAAAES